MRALWMTLCLSVGLVGCNYGKRNAQACEDWIETMNASFVGTACEGTDFSILIQGGCETYEESKCDISEYFVCLEENTECSDGGGSASVNTEQWTDCAPLATCE